MPRRKSLRRTLCFTLLLFAAFGPATADISKRDAVQRFISHMSETHGFEAQALNKLFTEARTIDSILKAISRPAEKKEWYQYRPIFLQSTRIKKGVAFWHKHRQTLARAQRLYNVPPEIITAIIGVETRYGKNTGSYRVIDALSTLAFSYPRRSDFFRSELEQYMLLCREHGLQPTALKGSYAGAMGIPQFISSSYRNYAIDFDGDGKSDIWSSPDDAIGSVANYFAQHGWQKGGEVALPVDAQGTRYQALISSDLKPATHFSVLSDHGVQSPRTLPANTPTRLLELHLKNGSELWLTLDNFYVITRYNHSSLYAMAVYQLSQEIRTKYLASHPL